MKNKKKTTPHRTKKKWGKIYDQKSIETKHYSSQNNTSFLEGKGSRFNLNEGINTYQGENKRRWK